jgi:hypothetical protein
MFSLLQNQSTGGQNMFCGGGSSGWHQWEGGGNRERGRKKNMVQIICTCVRKCKKCHLLKMFQESWEVGRKRAVEGVNSSVICLIYYKNLCKCYNVHPPHTAIKKYKRTKNK